MRPKVSILMPVKNTAAYLEECLLSIINQSFRDWELIAVDDHSDDNSLEILKNFARFDSRILVTTNNGKGIINALRLAYKFSSGEYIHRMDSDDKMHPEKIKHLLSEIIQKGRGVVVSGSVRYFSDSKTVDDGYRSYERWLNETGEKGTYFNEIYKECVIPSISWMLHKEDLDKIGAFSSSVYPEDYDLTFRMYKHQLLPVFVPDSIHYWRDHSTRTSRTSEVYKDNRFFSIKSDYFLRIDYLKGVPLVIWGAGRNGKDLVKEFLQRNIDIKWISNNPKKIGKHIYNQKIEPPDVLKNFKLAQILIAIANSAEQQEVELYLDNHFPRFQHFLFM